MGRDPLDKKIEPQPRSFWGLCAHCVEETRVRIRKMPTDGRLVSVCDACFRHGGIWLDFITPGPKPTTTWNAQGGPRKLFATEGDP